MPQTASKSKTKSSSTSKRHFTVVIGTKEHGLYCSSSPSSAARKAVSKLCGKEKGKKVEFCLREITQGSKKKTYGPYLGHIEKLAKPIQLKGRLVERTPVARLKPKTSAKKGGMRGGTLQGDFLADFDTAILVKPLRNSQNYNPSNSRLLITELSKIYIDKNLPIDEQKKLLEDSLQFKFNKIDYGNDEAVSVLRQKYSLFDIDISGNRLDDLTKRHSK